MSSQAIKNGDRHRQTFRAETKKYFALLGAHIAKTRKSLGFTQKELADRLGVSQQAVFAYEIGDRRVSVLVLDKLAKIFGVTIEALVRFSAPPPVRKQRLSPRAIRHAERLQSLSKSHQRFVVKIIDNLEERRDGRRL